MNTFKKLLLCLSVLGILTTTCIPTQINTVKANETQVVVNQEEKATEIVQEENQEPTEEHKNIGGGLTYQEQQTKANLTRGSPKLKINRILDFGTGEYIYESGYNAVTVIAPNGTRHNRVFAEFLLAGDRVFCIEPLILTDTGAEYEITPTENYLTSAEKINLGLIGFFGYGYDNDYSDAMLAATQAMIWKYRGYGLDTYKKEVQNKMNAIQHRMDTFTIRPSFEGQNLVFDGYGEKYAITLEDKNNVLADFHIYDNGGYKIEKKGNTLKVWVEKGSKPSGTIVLDRMNRDRLGNTVVWRNPDGKQTVAKVQWSDPSSMKINIKVNVGNVELTKKDDLGNAVPNAKFKFSTTPDMKNVYGIFTTNKDGKIKINDIPAKYDVLYYQEEFVPEPYVLDSKVKSIEVKYQKTTNATVVNNHQKGRITIHKEDSETGTTPQGDAQLSGWVFGLYADKDKKTKIQDLVGTGNKATSDLLDVNKTYYIYEEQVPLGYKINPEPVVVEIKYSNQTISVNEFNEVMLDEVIKGNISIHKTVDKPIGFSFLKSSIKQPLAGVEFTIKHDKTDKIVDTMITNINGYAKSKDLPYGWYTVTEKPVKGYETLAPFKVFIDKDGKTYNYYVENTAIVSNLKIVKKDAETNKTIPLSGFKFRLEDEKGNPVTQHITYPIPSEISVFSTAKNGTVTLPEPLTAGTYKIYEVASAGEYLLSNEPITFTVSAENPEPLITLDFKNTPAKGKFSLMKKGEQLIDWDFRQTELGKMYSPIYELQPLKNVKYNIIADEDIVTSDGTIRAKKDTIVDTITTNDDGIATTKELYLGKYRAEEIATVAPFIKDTTPYHFELKFKDQYTMIVKESHTFKNDRQKAEVVFSKNTEKVKEQTYNPLNDIQFAVYNRDDIKVKNNIILPKNSLIEVIKLDKNGNGKITTDLPIDEKFYLKEIKQGNGYIPLAQEFDFATTYGGDTTNVIKLQVNNGKPIENILMRSQLKIKKTSEDGKIQGIKFLIKGKTTVGTTYEQTFETNEKGEIEVVLLQGKYEIIEVSNDKTIGYITPDNQIVDLADKDIEVEVYNKLQRGNLEIHKTTDDNSEDLSGFGFKVHGTSLTGVEYDEDFETDKNGCIFIKDLLVGNYTISELDTEKSVGYIKPDDQSIFIAYDNTASVEVLNITMTGKLQIAKSVNDGKQDLSGFEFSVSGTTATGKAYKQILKTDHAGKAMIELPIGHYEIKEIANDASIGYILPDKQEVEITYQNTSTSKFVNEVMKGTLELTKTVNDKKSNLSGFEFLVEGITTTGVTLEQRIITDEAGKAVIQLPVGSYTIKEVNNNASKGYVLPPKKDFKINVEETTSLHMHNEKIIIPNTGDYTNNYYFTVFIASLSVISFLIMKRKYS